MENNIPIDIEFILKNVNLNTEAAKVKSEISGVSRTVRNESAQTGQSINKLGKDIFGTYSRFIAPAGAGLYAAFKFKQMAQEAYEFEKAFEMAMGEVETISKAVQNDFEDISQRLVDMAANGRDNAILLAKAYYQIVSAGYDGEAGLKLLEVASKAATAGLTDTVTAADGLTTVLNAWGISADKAQQVADVMFKTVERGKTTFGELAQNIAQAAPIAASAKIPFEQIFAAVQSITKQGTPTAQAMTQIRASIIGMNKVLGDGWKSTMTYQQGLQAVAEKAGGSQNKLKTLIPEVEAVNAVLALTGDKAKGAGEDLTETGKAVGSMEAAYNRMMDKAENKWIEVHNKWTREIKDFGKALKESSTLAADFFNAILSNGSDFSKDFTINGIPDRIKAFRIMGESLTSAYIKGGLATDAQVRELYGNFVSKIVAYAKTGYSGEKLKLDDVLAIDDKKIRSEKLNEFLKGLADSEAALGDQELQNSKQQQAALRIRDQLWTELKTTATDALKAIETQTDGTNAKARTLKDMLTDLKGFQDKMGTGSMQNDISLLVKMQSVRDEINKYFDKIREARKVEAGSAINPISGKDTLGTYQAITKEQAKQELEEKKILKSSEATRKEAEKKAAAIKEQNDKLTLQEAMTEQLKNGFSDASEILGAMSFAVGQLDDNLGQSLGKMADLAYNAADLVTNISSGNIVGAIASGIGILGNVFSQISQENEDRSLLALQKMNNLLEQQSTILANLSGENYFELASKQYSDLGEQIDNYVKQLQQVHIYNKEFNRSPQNKNWTADQFIDAYTRGVIVPDTQSLEQIKQIIELRQQQAQLLQDTFRQALGFDSSEVSDSIVSGIQSGLSLSQNGLGEWANNFGDLLKKALTQNIVDSLQTQYIAGFMDQFKQDVSDGVLSPDERQKLEDQYRAAVEAANADWEAIKPILDQYSTNQTDASQLTGAINGITEDTASLIAGQMNAMRVDVKSIIAQIAMGQDDTVRSLGYLKKIAENTEHNAELKPISKKLDTINDTLNKKL